MYVCVCVVCSLARSQEKQNEARYLRDHKEELIEELATTIVQKVRVRLSFTSSSEYSLLLMGFFFYNVLPLLLKYIIQTNFYPVVSLPPRLLLRSSRGGSDQICRQSTTLSGLNLSPWSSPASCRLRLSLRPRRRTRRTPSRIRTPCGWVLGKPNSESAAPKITSGVNNSVPSRGENVKMGLNQNDFLHYCLKNLEIRVVCFF